MEQEQNKALTSCSVISGHLSQSWRELELQCCGLYCGLDMDLWRDHVRERWGMDNDLSEEYGYC